MVRQRAKQRHQEEHDIALRLTDIITAAQKRGAITGTREPIRAQLDELRAWLEQ